MRDLGAFRRLMFLVFVTGALTALLMLFLAGDRGAGDQVSVSTSIADQQLHVRDGPALGQDLLSKLIADLGQDKTGVDTALILISGHPEMDGVVLQTDSLVSVLSGIGIGGGDTDLQHACGNGTIVNGLSSARALIAVANDNLGGITDPLSAKVDGNFRVTTGLGPRAVSTDNDGRTDPSTFPTGTLVAMLTEGFSRIGAHAPSGEVLKLPLGSGAVGSANRTTERHVASLIPGHPGNGSTVLQTDRL